MRCAPWCKATLSGQRWTPSDEDGDGSYESAQTLVTVSMTLPAQQLPTPGNPLPGCSRLLADTASVAQYAQQSDTTFVPPGAAQWKYQIGLTAHFYVADLALLHAGVMEPGKGYLTQAQAAMAADNLALFSQLMGNIQTLDIPSSDLMVSFVPAPELAQQTLGLISGMARAADDADCLPPMVWRVNSVPPVCTTRPARCCRWVTRWPVPWPPAPWNWSPCPAPPPERRRVFRW